MIDVCYRKEHSLQEKSKEEVLLEFPFIWIPKGETILSISVYTDSCVIVKFKSSKRDAESPIKFEHLYPYSVGHGYDYDNFQRLEKKTKNITDYSPEEIEEELQKVEFEYYKKKREENEEKKRIWHQNPAGYTKNDGYGFDEE